MRSCQRAPPRQRSGESTHRLRGAPAAAPAQRSSLALRPSPCRCTPGGCGGFARGAAVRIGARRRGLCASCAPLLVRLLAAARVGALGAAEEGLLLRNGGAAGATCQRSGPRRRLRCHARRRVRAARAALRARARPPERRACPQRRPRGGREQQRACSGRMVLVSKSASIPSTDVRTASTRACMAAPARSGARVFARRDPSFFRRYGPLASVLPLPGAQSTVQAARMGPPAAAAPGGAADDAAWVEAMLAAEGPLTAEQARAPTARVQRGRAAAAQRRPARAFRVRALRRARGVTRRTRHLASRAALTAAAAGAGGAAAAAQRARGCGGGARGVPAA